MPKARLAVAAGLAAVCLLAYLPSFNVAFFLDDFRIIVENPALYQPFDIGAVWSFSKARFIASLTLAFNYWMHGDGVFGFHVVNLLIHLGAGAAVYLLAAGLLRAAGHGESSGALRYMPWLAAAIFLLHPLQTQAVTYVVQRYTSLMALLYLGALAAYVFARLRGSRALYVSAALLAVLALLCKQSAATLPVAVLFIELVFFRRLDARTWIAIIAAGLAAAGGIAALVHHPALDVNGLTRATEDIARNDYLATQMEVLWRYIGLFFLIGQQRLEYDLALAEGFSQPFTLALALGHVTLIAIGLALWRRSPLLCFGVVFYYIAHAVESGYLPIPDLAFEHRTYLPNAGAGIAAALPLAWLLERGRGQRARIAGWIAVGILLVTLAVATHARNALWADRIGFLEREAELSPNHQRAWTSLGKELMREARFQDALNALVRARDIALERDGGELRPPTLLNLIFALHYTGRNRAALELADSTPVDRFNRTERAFYYEARGRALLDLRRFQDARQALFRAARLNPTPNIVAHLALAELELGRPDRARGLAEEILDNSPGHPVAREVLARTRRDWQSTSR